MVRFIFKRGTSKEVKGVLESKCDEFLLELTSISDAILKAPHAQICSFRPFSGKARKKGDMSKAEKKSHS